MKKATSSHTKNLRLVLLGALGLALLLVLAFGLKRHWLDNGSPAAISGAFSLTDQNGHDVTDADFRGKVMVVYFGYTFCPDLCPTALANLTQAYDQLTPEERAQIVPVFITVDPDRDTVKQMAQYVGAISPSLVGLTGSPDQIAAVLKSYRIYAKKADLGNGDYGVDHSSVLYVMGRNGGYLGNLDPNATPEVLSAGMRKFL